MIKYIKELDNLDEQYLNLVYPNIIKNKKIYNNSLPDDYYIENMHLFITIDELDLLYKNKFGKSGLINANIFDKKFEEFFEEYANNKDKFDFSKYGLTSDGITRLEFLVNDFNSRYTGDMYSFDYYDELEVFVESIVSLFYLDHEILNRSNNRFLLERYLNAVLEVGSYQNKLSISVKNSIRDAIDNIKKYDFEVSLNESDPVDYKLPNCWYITPFNHLYNSMGKNANKESNLLYAYEEVFDDKIVYNPEIYLKEISDIKKTSSISNTNYKHYLNLIYDMPVVYPECYYNMDSADQDSYRFLYKRSYNSKLINLIIGIISAHAGFYSFFHKLKQQDTFEENLEYLKDYDIDEILVRCCGFHKISSVMNKTITTSSLNYEKEFKEYIDKGWSIDFVTPIVLDENNKLKEYDDSLAKIRQLKRY